MKPYYSEVGRYVSQMTNIPDKLRRDVAIKILENISESKAMFGQQKNPNVINLNDFAFDGGSDSEDGYGSFSEEDSDEPTNYYDYEEEKDDNGYLDNSFSNLSIQPPGASGGSGNAPGGNLFPNLGGTSGSGNLGGSSGGIFPSGGTSGGGNLGGSSSGTGIFPSGGNLGGSSGGIFPSGGNLGGSSSGTGIFPSGGNLGGTSGGSLFPNNGAPSGGNLGGTSGGSLFPSSGSSGGGSLFPSNTGTSNVPNTGGLAGAQPVSPSRMTSTIPYNINTQSSGGNINLGVTPSSNTPSGGSGNLNLSGSLFSSTGGGNLGGTGGGNLFPSSGTSGGGNLFPSSGTGGGNLGGSSGGNLFPSSGTSNVPNTGGSNIFSGINLGGSNLFPSNTGTSGGGKSRPSNIVDLGSSVTSNQRQFNLGPTQDIGKMKCTGRPYGVITYSGFKLDVMWSGLQKFIGRGEFISAAMTATEIYKLGDINCKHAKTLLTRLSVIATEDIGPADIPIAILAMKNVGRWKSAGSGLPVLREIIALIQCMVNAKKSRIASWFWDVYTQPNSSQIARNMEIPVDRGVADVVGGQYREDENLGMFVTNSDDATFKAYVNLFLIRIKARDPNAIFWLFQIMYHIKSKGIKIKRPSHNRVNTLTGGKRSVTTNPMQVIFAIYRAILNNAVFFVNVCEDAYMAESATSKNRRPYLMLPMMVILYDIKVDDRSLQDSTIPHSTIAGLDQTAKQLVQSKYKLSIPSYVYDKHTSEGRKKNMGRKEFVQEGAIVKNEYDFGEFAQKLKRIYENDHTRENVSL